MDEADERKPMRVAVVALLGMVDGQTAEATKECEWEELPGVLATLESAPGGWRAITIVHIEDFPKVMEGASYVG